MVAPCKFTYLLEAQVYFDISIGNAPSMPLHAD